MFMVMVVLVGSHFACMMHDDDGKQIKLHVCKVRRCYKCQGFNNISLNQHTD